MPSSPPSQCAPISPTILPLLSTFPMNFRLIAPHWPDITRLLAWHHFVSYLSLLVNFCPIFISSFCSPSANQNPLHLYHLPGFVPSTHLFHLNLPHTTITLKEDPDLKHCISMSSKVAAWPIELIQYFVLHARFRWSTPLPVNNANVCIERRLWFGCCWGNLVGIAAVHLLHGSWWRCCVCGEGLGVWSGEMPGCVFSWMDQPSRQGLWKLGSWEMNGTQQNTQLPIKVTVFIGLKYLF